MNRCTHAVIYKDNLKHNLEQIKQYVAPETKICLAVKADSYGHNAVLTSNLAEQMGIDLRLFGVNDEVRATSEWAIVRSRVDAEEMVAF